LEIEAFRISTPTSGQIIILIVLIVAVILAFVIASKNISTGRKRQRKPSSTGWNNFYQIAKARNLSKEETELLKSLILASGVKKPTLVFTSTNVLDSCIQRAIRKLSLSEIKGESKDDLISTYYRLRNKIMRGKNSRRIATTRTIPVGAKLRVTLKNYGSFSVKVNNNEDKYLGISIPILIPGKVIPWARKKIVCEYWRPNDAVYTFETKVADVLINDEIQTICLKHTDRIKRTQKRLYPRKSIRLPVIFSLVKIINKEGKKKAIVDRKESHWGTIVDISAGGLSIETTSPIDKNNYIRVEFEIKEDYKIVAFGKVKRIERNALRKTWIMHCQFTKIDKKNRNEIFALLYNYQTV